MRNKYLLSFLCSLPLFAADSPSAIHGVVLDPSGRPVESARVSCGPETVYSNAEGRFTIAGASKCDAHIDKSGFQTEKASLTDQTETRITLKLQGPTETVVVSATRSQTTTEEAAVAGDVITERQFRVLDYPIVADVLRDIPGLQVSNYNGPGGLTQVYTRGAQRTGTLVLLDGVPLNDPGGELNLAHVSSAGIDRVEVIRGPESAQFGAEASAGVIQLFTKRGNPEDRIPHGILSYERGSFQTDRWIAGLDGGFGGRLDYALTADQFHAVGEYPNDFYRNNTGSANIGYRISDATQVRGIFRIYDAHVGTPSQVAYNAINYVANEEIRNSTVSVRVDDSRGSNYLQRFSFGYNRLRDRYNDDEPFSTQPLAALVRDAPGPLSRVYFVRLLDPNGPLPISSQLPAGVRVAEATAFYGPSDSLNLTERRTAGYQGTLSHSGGALVFGYDYQHQSATVSDLDVSRENHGLFLNAQQSIGPRVYLSAGGRFEHSSRFGSIGTGRGGASFLLFREHGALSSTFLRFSAGRGVTEPSLYENFVQASFAQGNPNLKPEKTNTYEAGLVQEWFGRRVRTEVSVFRSSFQDLIAYIYPSWQNIEASWARGIEASIEARPVRYVLFTATYMRLYTKITESSAPSSPVTGVGYELVRRPRNSGAVSVALTPRRWSFVMGARIIGERQDSDFTFGVNRNPGYENVYLSGSYQIGKHFTPVFRIENLIDEKYEDILGFANLRRSITGGVRIHW